MVWRQRDDGDDGRTWGSTVYNHRVTLSPHFVGRRWVRILVGWEENEGGSCGCMSLELVGGSVGLDLA